jgi:DNA-binding NtrC family response regulator
MLKNYSWPGNIRELENIIERAILVSSKSRLSSDDFNIPDNSVSPVNVQVENSETGSIFSENIVPLEEVEKEYLKYSFKKANGNISLLARRLKIGRATLYRKLQKYNIASE